MTEENEKYLNTLIEKNSYEYNLLKVVEELGELITAISQRVTKQDKVKVYDLIEELVDVEIQLYALKKIYDLDPIFIEIAKDLKLNEKRENESN